jgi:multimeric flavodoxin WrbA
MKILAFNGSPNMEQGATAGFMDYFLEGAKNAGGEVQVIYVHKLDIEPCTGCFNCWIGTPGECIHDDDMGAIYDQVRDTETIVLGTPVYVDGMTGIMKTMLDRMIPLMSGKVEIIDGHCRHPQRYPIPNGKLVLVSVCGFAELDNFDPLIAHVKAMAKNMQREFVGAVVRPYAWTLPVVMKQGMDVADIIKATMRAGEELVRDAAFSTETLETISRDFLSQQSVADMISGQFQ